MRNDVRMDVVGEMEADRYCLRAGLGGVIVRNGRNPRRQREPNGDRGGWPDDMRRSGQLGGRGRWGEGAGIHQAPGVNRPETGVYPPGQLIQGVRQVSDECRWHDEGLRKVVEYRLR